MINSLPVSTLTLQGSEINSILEIFNTLNKEFTAEFITDFNFDFRPFELFSSYKQIDTGPVIYLKNESSSFYLTFTQVTYQLPNASRFPHLPSREYQTWGVLHLNKNSGHVLIRPETFLDKIHNLITPIQLDFEDDKEFSRKFYIVTNDELKTNLLFTPGLKSGIESIGVPDFCIEILENSLIIGNKKIIEPGSALKFAEFLRTFRNEYL